MKIYLILSFKEDSLDGTFYDFLFEKFIRFEPKLFVKSNKVVPWNPKKHRKSIRQAESGESIALQDGFGNSLSVNKTGARHPHQSITITQDRALCEFSNHDVVATINDTNNFVSAYMCNWEYTYVQSNASASTFAGRNIPVDIMETLKHVPSKLGVFNDVVYDVRYNPGRLVLVSSTWLVAAYKMWFGLPFFDIVPKEKLLDFPYAVKKEKLANGYAYIQLFDRIEDPYSPDNIFKQWKWQEWINYDEIESK